MYMKIMLKKLQMKLKNLWIKFIIIIIIIIYIWYKIIYERLPKTIPFVFSFLSLFSVLFLILSFIFKLYTLSKKNSNIGYLYTNKLLQEIQNQITKSNSILEITNKIIKYKLNSLVYIEYFIKYLMCFLLFYDIFFIEKIFFTYKFAFMYLFVFLFKFFIVSCNVTIKSKFNSLLQKTDIIINSKNIINSEMFFKSKLNNENLSHDFWPKYDYIKKRHKELNLKPQQKLNVKVILKNLQVELDDIIEKSKNIKKLNNFYNTLGHKILNIILNIIYLICWIYVLFVSIHTLNVLEFFEVLNSTWLNIDNPFSNTTIFYDI